MAASCRSHSQHKYRLLQTSCRSRVAMTLQLLLWQLHPGPAPITRSGAPMQTAVDLMHTLLSDDTAVNALWPQRIHSCVTCRDDKLQKGGCTHRCTAVTSGPANCGGLAADIAVRPPQRGRSCGNHGQGCVGGRTEQPGEGTVAAVRQCYLAFACMQKRARLSRSKTAS